MSSCPVEVVFPLDTPSGRLTKQDSALFRYTSGPVKVPGPWRRGRPKGSKNKAIKGAGGSKSRGSPAIQYEFEFVHHSPGSGDVVRTSQPGTPRHAKGSPRASRNMELYPYLTRREAADREDETNMREALASLKKLNLHQITGVDPFGAFPVQFEPYMHDLLLYFSTTIWKQLYSLEKIAGYNPFTEYWLPLALQDSALLHCFIGCAGAYTSFFTSLKDGSRGLWHLNEAISTVSRRLRTSQAIMERGTLVIIVGMAMVERGSGYHGNWRTHMLGLKHLVDSCGGIRNFDSEPMILNKIVRADLYGSLDDASSPYFGELCSLIDEAPSESAFHSDGFRAIHEATGLDLTLLRCIHLLEEAMQLWSNAGGLSPGSRQDGENVALNWKKRPGLSEAIRVRQLLTSVQYALISNRFQEFCAAQASQVLEACRLGLILYSLTILNERPSNVAYGIPLITKVRRTLDDVGGEIAGHIGADQLISLPVDFQLWVLFLATIVATVPDADTREWLLGSFARLSSHEHGNILSWSDLRCRLSQYLWVPSVHDEPAQRLWLETEELRQSR
ncbi:hypothetical protein GQ53DRAFT_363912 [Thozetella sp. PMI_491]|nr:hypothetical protein GQ53DRAFT_363912 [Thozetella sp. PMI_491]